MKVLQQDFVGGLWNKPAYLLSLVLQELEKPASEQAKWLMFVLPQGPSTVLDMHADLCCNRWVDADTIILNPAIPPDIFLPPADMPDIYMLSAKDLVGLNVGVLFFRVHKWTVDFLVETLTYSWYVPEEEDLAFTYWPEQEAMARILKRPSTGSEKRAFREGNVYLPREWINSYHQYDEERRKKGDMLVHFPGMKEDRWPAMADWLNIIEHTPNEWEVPLEQTDYPEMTSQFWDKFRTARDIVKGAEEDIRRAPQGTPTSARAAAISQLKIALQEHADQPELLQQRLDELRAAVSKEV